MSTAATRPLTPQEFLARERLADRKSEYLDGVVYAMSGASLPHNFLTGNLFFQIRLRLGDVRCEVFANDMRVMIGPTQSYVYPDVVAVCGPPELLDGQFDTLLNPTLLIEVLSPSTAGYDRGLKFEHYRRIPSLREYVLVTQGRVFVERHARAEDGAWRLTELSRRDQDLTIDCLGITVPLREVYRGVDVPEGVVTAEE